MQVRVPGSSGGVAGQSGPGLVDGSSERENSSWEGDLEIEYLHWQRWRRVPIAAEAPAM